MRSGLYHIYACILFLLTCCNKKPVGETITHFTLERYIVNALNRPVNIRVYRSEADYKSDINALVSQRILPGDTSYWTVHEHIDSCFVDWYTDSYELTNWGVIVPRPKTGFELEYNVFEFQVLGASLQERMFLPVLDNVGHVRKIFLDFNTPETKWKVFDARDSITHGSVWNQLPGDDQFHEFTFSKDMKYVWIRNETGQIKPETGRFSPAVDTAKKPMLNYKLQRDSDYYPAIHVFNRNPVNTSDFKTDTLYFFRAGKYFMMKKIR